MVPELVKGCRHTKRHGVFTVSLAATLAEYGLTVAFHSDPDSEIGGFECQCYARARPLSVLPQPALNLSRLLTEVHQGHLPIVLFNTDSQVAHFSPLIGFANGRLQLPLAHGDSMSDGKFLMRWSVSGILRQCVIIN